MSASTSPGLAAESPQPSESSKRLLPWLVAVAFFMESLDTTILNTAVPAVSEALNVAPLAMKAVLASYTLSLAVFIPISGWMADRFGTRRVFSSAIGLFTFGSLLCGLCSNIHLLVACRIVQGMGGALMVPVGRLTLVRTFPRSDLIRIMSFVSIPALVAPMLGPIAGGLIVGYFHWRVIFFLNIPIGIVGLIMVYLHLPNYSEETHALDAVGLILFGSGIALLSYVLEVFGEHTLSGREIASMLGLSLALLLGYWLHAKTLQYPLLQLRLLAIRTLRVSVSGGLFTRLGIGGVPFLLPLLYQTGLGYTPIQSGLLIMPQALGAMGVKAVLRPVLGLLGYRGVLISNTIVIGALLAVFSIIGEHTPGVGHRAAAVRLRLVHFAPIHKHEHPGVCGHWGPRRQCGKFHRQHDTADVDQLRRRHCRTDHCIFRARGSFVRPLRNDSWHPSGISCAWGVDGRVHACLRRPQAR